MRPAHRVLSLVAVAIAFTLALLAPRAGFAQSRAVEGQAKALQKKAMEEDYLNVDLDKAADKLNQAIAKCGTDKCASGLRAALKRDLATVQSAANKKDDALSAMTDAVRIDPGIQLDPNYTTKELEALLNSARKAAAAGGGSSGGTSGSSGGGGGGKTPPSGDFTHTPAAEQAVRTAVPIFVEYGGSEELTKVIAKYKGFGMTEFKSVELKKMANGWGGSTPCADSGQGELQYYIQGFNAANDPVATAGDRNNPYRVPIKRQIAGDPPHLPGQSPPTQCADTGDCPPDFPGCKGGGGATTPKPDEETPKGKGEGDDCEEDGQCASGTCKDSKCTAASGAADDKGASDFKRNWIGVAGSLDLAFVPSGSDVCLLNPNTGLPVNSSGYYCADGSTNFPARRSDGDQTGQQNSQIIAGKNDKVQGGMTPGNVRLMVSYDRAFSYNLLVGVRLGFVLNTYSGTAAGSDGFGTSAPVHLEVRGTYVIGDKALAKKGAKPFVFVAAGYGEFDASVGVTVQECSASTTNNNKTCGGAQAQKGTNAWEIAGPFFAAVGGGVRYALSPTAALTLGLKLTGVFGSTGFLFAPAPEVGFQFGFGGGGKKSAKTPEPESTPEPAAEPASSAPAPEPGETP